MSHWELSVRVRSQNPDHHLFNNNGTWWCHFWAIADGARQQRFRVNLKTKSRLEARFLRNGILKAGWRQYVTKCSEGGHNV